MNGSFILGGDFNCVLNPTIDRSTGRDMGKTRTRELLKQFVEDPNLVDVWRERNPDKNHYSCYSSAYKSHSRIDYFLISRELLPKVSECWYNGIVISDHAAVSLKIQIDKIVHSPPNWRFQARWLQDQAFVDTIGSKISSFFALNTDETSACTRWEAFKAFIRGEVISYTSYKTKHYKMEMESLENQIKILENDLYAKDDPLKQKELIILRARYNKMLWRQKLDVVETRLP